AKGKPSQNEMNLFVQFGDFLKAAGSAGVIAGIGGEGGGKSMGMDLMHMGVFGVNAEFLIFVVSMSVEDQGQLERFLERGLAPRVRLNVQNAFTNGFVETANVVGEIRGREHPEEILVVGGHLDSWDLSEGMIDNGSGAAAMLGAT